MGYWAALQQLQRIAKERGAVRNRDIVAMDLSHNWVELFGTEFERRARGVFFPVGVVPDRLVILLAKYPRMVVGLTTALWLHKVLPRPPEDWLVHALNCPEPIRYPQAIMVRTTWPFQQIEEMKLQGVTFRVQQPARAALDCIRFRQRLGPRRAQRAVKEALASGLATVEAMREIAKATRLARPLERMLAALQEAPSRREQDPPIVSAADGN